MPSAAPGPARACSAIIARPTAERDQRLDAPAAASPGAPVGGLGGRQHRGRCGIAPSGGGSRPPCSLTPRPPAQLGAAGYAADRS